MPEIAFHPAPVGCRSCGTVLQATHAAAAGFACPTCGEPVCYVCGCVEERACAGTDDLPCFWLADGLCSFCGGRAAYELFMAATGRPAVDPFYLERAPSAFVVRGLEAGLDRMGELRAGFAGRP